MTRCGCELLVLICRQLTDLSYTLYKLNAGRYSPMSLVEILLILFMLLK